MEYNQEKKENIIHSLIVDHGSQENKLGELTKKKYILPFFKMILF